MRYTAFHDQRFRNSLELAMKQVKTILDNTRNPQLAENEDHTYADKFALCEFLTNTAIASQMTAFESMGLDITGGKLQEISKDWVQNEKKTVTLRFQAHDSCSFLKEQDVELFNFEQTSETNTQTANSGGSGFFGSSQKTETTKKRVVTKVKEYHWKVEVSFKIILFPGTDTSKAVVLNSRTSSTIVVTSGGQHGQMKPAAPLPEYTEHPNIDADVTWFFRMISADQVCQFSIDRSSLSEKGEKRTCKTPRRNEDVQKAFEFNKQLYSWAEKTKDFFLKRVEQMILRQHNPVQKTPTTATGTPENIIHPPGTRAVITGLQKEPTFNGKVVILCEYTLEQHRYRVEPVDPPAISGLPPTMLIKPQNVKVDSTNQNAVNFSNVNTIAQTLFCPIAPLMEQGKVLTVADVGSFLSEQSRSIDAAIDQLSALYPPRQLVKLVSVAEASVVLLCHHLVKLTESYQDGVDYVEHMLKTQLIQAIGKEVGSKDFDDFMVFHSRKLFAPEYAPKPYTYAIRRPNHDPDGLISIETMGQQPNEKNEPIQTMVRYIPSATVVDNDAETKEGVKIPSLFIPISAATTVEITGDRYLHGWIQNSFQSEPQRKYQLVARARQFSSFLLVLGTIAGADRFEPKEAIILQNKDEVIIPLLVNTLPSAKDFKDSIASLSPEQQSFAKAFRSMQLESSVFGLCIIQIKPQLEKVLGLPMGSLTKEIQLMQDLMSLFVEYQIPSDLLTFDGADDHEACTKVATVKGHVKSVLEVIENEKKKQLKEEIERADMRIEMAAAREMNDPWRHKFAVQNACFGAPPVALPIEMGFATNQLELQRDVMSTSAGVAAGGFGPPGPMMKRAMMMKPQQRFEYQSFQSVSLAERATSQALGSKERKDEVNKSSSGFTGGPASSLERLDFTMVPKILDSKIEKFDDDNALRSVVIKTAQTWTRKRPENLLIAPKTSSLTANAINDEKKKAFDLLDAISRSGVLPIDFSDFHVLVGVSHCFDNNLMGTIIEDNINPIEKVEKSSMLIASTIYERTPTDIIKDPSHAHRLERAFPQLFIASADDVADATTESVGDNEH